MVCSNCQSKEVIKVQDEWFCTNCGAIIPTAAEVATAQISGSVSDVSVEEVAAADLPAGVTVSPEMAAVMPAITNHAKTSGAVAVASVATTKKRKVGRPKAKRLDTPKETIVAETPTVEPVQVQAPRITEAAVKHKAPAKVGSHKMSDIAPRTTTSATSRATKASEGSTDTQVAVSANDSTSPKPKKVHHHPAINYAEIEAESWTGRWHPKYAFLMFFPAVLLALLAGGFTTAWLSTTPSEFMKITWAALYPILGEVVLVLMLYYISHSLAASALTFGIARDADHRPAPKSRWWGVAVNSFGARLRLDIGSTILQLIGLALVVALVLTGGLAWPIPEMLQIAALLIAFVVMLYLVAGIGLAQSLGRVAVTLGVVPAHKALGLGWDFFRHHFDLVGARLIGLLMDLVMVIPFAALAIVIGLYAPNGSKWAIVALVMLGVMVVGALMGAGGAIWWQAVYRKLVRNERITEVMSLLAGRQAERPKRLQLIALSVTITILFVLAVVWPWLPLPAL